jgi:DNA helicase-2/ATP-dependent DNA helicase PcrA
MGERIAVIGPPGTGKTHSLMDEIGQLLNRGVKPEQICAVTFTRVAAREIKKRLVDEFPQYESKNFPWVGTLHSLCKKILGVSSAQLFLGKPVGEFCDLYHYRFSPEKLREAEEEDIEVQEQMLSTTGDWFEHFDSRRRNAMRSFEEEMKTFWDLAFGKAPGDWLPGTQRLYCERKAKFLREKGYWDFTALLEEVLRRKLFPPGVRYIFCDEAQDNSPLLWCVLSQWAETCERFTALGDPDQCLPDGTMITTPEGERPMESIKVGDEVTAAAGKGHMAAGRVSEVFTKYVSELFVTIKLEGGIEIQPTAGHKVFCFIDDKADDIWYVYLMKKKGVGWRLGITKLPIKRFRLERTADQLVLIQACQDVEEARFWEAHYSLKYGIPTSVFYSRGGISNADFTARLNKSLGCSPDRLSADLGISIDYPQFRRHGVSVEGFTRLLVNVHMCYTPTHRNDRSKVSTSHLVSIETSDLKSIEKLKAKGYQLLPGRRSSAGTQVWRYRKTGQDLRTIYEEARRIAEITGAEINVVASLGGIAGKSTTSIVTTAGNILPGFYMPCREGETIVYKRVLEAKKELKMARVHDFNVEIYHNYIANQVVVHNCIYDFLPADPLWFLKFIDSARRIELKQSYRLPRRIQAVSEMWIKQNKERVDRPFYPRDADGQVKGRCHLSEFPWDEYSVPVPGEEEHKWVAFVLSRTRWQANQMKSWFLERGIPFAVNRGTMNPLQTSKGRLVFAIVRLVEGERVPAGDLKGVLKWIPAKPWMQHGGKTHFKEFIEGNKEKLLGWGDLMWNGFTPEYLDTLETGDFLKALKFTVTEKAYLRRCYDRFGKYVFLNIPNILVTNIHGIKGMEAENVILDPTLSSNPWQAMQNTPEEERRVGYTGITRARKGLFILEPNWASAGCYDFPLGAAGGPYPAGGQFERDYGS